MTKNDELLDIVERSSPENENTQPNRDEMLEIINHEDFDVDAASATGETAVFASISKNRPWLFGVLLINNADMKKPIIVKINEIGKKEWSDASECAMAYGMTKALEMLKSEGFKFDCATDFASECLLDNADRHNSQYVEWSIENGVDYKYRDIRNRSFLLSIMQGFHISKINATDNKSIFHLMEYKEQINAINSEDESSVIGAFNHWVSCSKNSVYDNFNETHRENIANALLSNTYTENTYCTEVIKLVRNMSQYSNNDFLGMYLSNNHIDDVDANGETLLMGAVMARDIVLVERIMRGYGASDEIISNNGKTAKSIAKELGEVEIYFKINEILEERKSEKDNSR